MNIKLLITTLCIMLACQQLQAQKEAGFTLVRSYQGDIVQAAMDNLGDLFLVSSTGQVRELNANGDSIGAYSQVKNFGNLTAIDVSNPMKVLLFYKDFATVVVLDRYLAARTTLDLKRFNVLQPSAVALSYDNKIWVFDEYDSKLKKIDESGTVLLETPDFRTLFSDNISPQKIINDNGLVYLADTASGLFVFDNYGSFKKKLPVTNWMSLEVRNSLVISTHHDEIVVYNPGTFQEMRQRIPAFTPYLHSFTGNDKFIIFSKNSLSVYKWR
jgi:hypothetical protein